MAILSVGMRSLTCDLRATVLVRRCWCDDVGATSFVRRGIKPLTADLSRTAQAE